MLTTWVNKKHYLWKDSVYSNNRWFEIDAMYLPTVRMKHAVLMITSYFFFGYADHMIQCDFLELL